MYAFACLGSPARYVLFRSHSPLRFLARCHRASCPRDRGSSRNGSGRTSYSDRARGRGTRRCPSGPPPARYDGSARAGGRPTTTVLSPGSLARSTYFVQHSQRVCWDCHRRTRRTRVGAREDTQLHRAVWSVKHSCVVAHMRDMFCCIFFRTVDENIHYLCLCEALIPPPLPGHSLCNVCERSGSSGGGDSPDRVCTCSR